MNGWAPILRAAEIEADQFERACENPQSAQLNLLKHILHCNAGCEFGSAHGFDTIHDLDAFRSRVPIRRYGEMEPWIDRVARGENSVLSCHPIVAFEETGGSTGGHKLIPYTKPALRAFRAAVLPWLFDLSQRRPAAFAGTAYVAASPVTRAARTTAGGHSIGLPSEAAYLGDDLISAFATVAAVPARISSIQDVPSWRFATLLHLLKAKDLSLISVWSPTFLIVLMDALPNLAASLVKALHDGRLSAEAPAAGGRKLEPDPERAREIEKAVSTRPINTAAIWPQLDTISAWTCGPSAMYARHLQNMFPHVALAPKGLLATEGAVTTPWSGLPYPAPALTSSFIEFIDDDGRVHLCDDLTRGSVYRIVITTPGGLYRYDLGDRVRCHTTTGALSQLEFVGRAGAGSDLVGEKLTEEFVAEVLGAAGLRASLVAHLTPQPFYELLVQDATPDRAASLSESVEHSLCRNPQYAYARAIGQLGPLRPCAVPDLLDRLVTDQAQRGRRLGDIKPPTLIFDAHLRDLLTK